MLTTLAMRWMVDDEDARDESRGCLNDADRMCSIRSTRGEGKGGSYGG